MRLTRITEKENPQSKTDKKAVTILQLIEKWLDELDRAKTTKTMYRGASVWFYRWMVNNKRDALKPTSKDAVDYKKNLMDNNKSPCTVNLYLSGVTQFFAWMEKNGLGKNVFAMVRRIKTKAEITKQILTPDQIKTLLDSIKKESLKDLRDRAIIILMYCNALRGSEVMGMNVGDYRENQILIMGKGREAKEFITLSEATIQTLNEYMAAHPYSNIPKAPLFISMTPQGVRDSSRLAVNNMRVMFQERIEAVGIKQPQITPHSLRHSAAVQLIKEKVPIFEISLFMRHSSLTTTRIYTKMVEEELRGKNVLQKVLENGLF